METAKSRSANTYQRAIISYITYRIRSEELTQDLQDYIENRSVIWIERGKKHYDQFMMAFIQFIKR